MLLTAAQHLAYSLHVAMSLGRGPPVDAVATLFFLSLFSPDVRVSSQRSIVYLDCCGITLFCAVHKLFFFL